MKFRNKSTFYAIRVVPGLDCNSLISNYFVIFMLLPCTRTNGGCIITVRDYDIEDKTDQNTKFYGSREVDGTTYLILQKWNFHGDIYDLSMYFVEDDGSNVNTHVMRSKYYAIGVLKLMALMTEAGFTDVQRLDNKFFQPVIIGTKRHNKRLWRQ